MNRKVSRSFVCKRCGVTAVKDFGSFHICAAPEREQQEPQEPQQDYGGTRATPDEARFFTGLRTYGGRGHATYRWNGAETH